MSNSSAPIVTPCDGIAADASDSSVGSVSPQLSPRKKGRLDSDDAPAMSIAQSFNLHELLCSMCESDGSRYPDSVILEAITAFEQQVTQDPLSPLRGATFSTKRLERHAPPAGNEACNWRLCFGATPFKCSDGEAAIQCQSASGVLQSEYVKNLRDALDKSFRLRNWQSNLDENNRRLVRAEMFYISAVKMLFHHSHPLLVTKSIDIVAEVCSRASYEDLLGLKGADDVDSIACLSALATSLVNQNKFDEARQCYMKCIAGSQAARGNSESIVRLQLDLANMLFKQGSLEEPVVMCLRILPESDQNSKSALSAAAHISKLAEQVAKSKIAPHVVEADCAGKPSVLTKVFEHALSLNAVCEMNFFRPFISLLNNDFETNKTSSVPVLHFLLSFFQFAQMLLNAKTYDDMLRRFKKLGLHDCHFYISFGDWQRAGLVVPPWNLLDFWNITVSYAREVSTSFALPVNVDSLPVAMRMHSILYSSSLPPNIDLGLPNCKSQKMREAELEQLVGKMREHAEHITQLNLSQQISLHEIRAPLIVDLTESLVKLTALQLLDLSHASYARDLPPSFCIRCKKGHALKQENHEPELPHIEWLTGGRCIIRTPPTCALCNWNANRYEERVMFHKRYHWQRSWRCNICKFEVCYVCAHTKFATSLPLDTVIDAALARSLMALNGLKSLNLSGTDFIKRCDTMLQLADSVAKLTALEHLNLSSASLNPNVNASLGRMLMSLTGLKTLNLSEVGFIGKDKASFCHSVLPSIVQLCNLQYFFVDETAWDFIRGGFWLQIGMVVPPFDVLPEDKHIWRGIGRHDSSIDAAAGVLAKNWVKVLRYAREVSTSFALPVNVDSLPVAMRMHAILYSSSLPPNIEITDVSRPLSPYRLCEAELMQLLHKLCRHSNIVTHLNINADEVSSENLRSMMQEVWKCKADSACLQRLTLSGFWHYDHSFCIALQFLTRLHSLDLQLSKEQEQQIDLAHTCTNLYQSLASLSGLRNLTLSGFWHYDHSFCIALLFLTGLYSLDLQFSKAQKQQIDLAHTCTNLYQSLASLSGLRRLDLAWAGHQEVLLWQSRNCRESDYKVITKAKKVDDVWGRGETSLTLNLYNDFDVPPSFFSSLKTLNLKNCENCDQNMLRGMVGLQTLRIIRIVDDEVRIPSINVALCQSLVALTRLQSLDMYATFDEQSAAVFLQSCASLTALQSLTFSCLHFKETAAVVEFCKSLTVLKTLRSLDLKFPRRIESRAGLWGNVYVKTACELGDFFESLKSMHELDTLIIGFNEIEKVYAKKHQECYPPPQSIRSKETFHQALVLLTGLTTLKLPYWGYDASIFSSLAALTQLEALDLQCNKIPGTAFPDMCRTLFLLTNLKHLNLSMILIDESGWPSCRMITAEDHSNFGRSLKSMTALRTLDLSDLCQNMDNSFYGELALSLVQLTLLESAKLSQSVYDCIRSGYWQRAGLSVPPYDITHGRASDDRSKCDWIKALQFCWQNSPPFPMPLDLKTLPSLQRRHAILYSASIPAIINFKWLLSHELQQLVQKLRSPSNNVTHLSLDLGQLDQMDIIPQLAAAISGLTALQALSLAYRAKHREPGQIDHDCAVLPPSFTLTAMTSLEVLRLIGFNICALCAGGGFDIGRSLAAMSGLRTLKISSHCSCEGSWATLRVSLLHLTMLEQLNVSGFDLCAGGGFDIGRTLAAMSGLRTLKISRCHFWKESTFTLWASLHNFTLLERFKLARIPAWQTADVASFLITLTSLKMLNLAGIQLDKHTCCVIARSCMQLTQLRNLLLCRDFLQCGHEWIQLGLHLPQEIKYAYNRYYTSGSELDNKCNWNYALRHQLCFQLVCSSRHHLTRALSICTPSSFSGLLGHTTTPDSVWSHAMYHPQTQSQLFLLMCFGGHTSHFIHVVMSDIIRKRKNPRAIVIERLFSKQMVQHLLRLSNYQDTQMVNKHEWSHKYQQN